MYEVWKPVDGYEGYYEVSNIGRVKSVDRLIRGRDGVVQRRRGVIKEQALDKSGYPQVNLYKDGGQQRVAVHILVARAFVDGWFLGAEVNHKDFDRQNAHSSNLEWVSHNDNVKHSVNAGHQACGERNGRSIPVILIDEFELSHNFSTIKECAEYIRSIRGLQYKIDSISERISKSINSGSKCYGFDIHSA